MSSLARLMGRSREVDRMRAAELLFLAQRRERLRRIKEAMLRLAGLDDPGMDIKEARLWREVRHFQAEAHQRRGKRGCMAKARDAMSDYAVRRAEAALHKAKQRSQR